MDDERARDLPAHPPHGFVGRRRELEEGERILAERRRLVLRGEHGEGKTALAAELARRMLAGAGVERVAYVSLETCHDARGARFGVGRQLVPRYRLAAQQDPRLALQLLERVLEDSPSLVVFDDLEAVLPAAGDPAAGDPAAGDPAAGDPAAGDPAGAPDGRLFEPTVRDQLMVLCRELLEVGRTRLLLVSREGLPGPFGEPELHLAALATDDAVALVRGVLAARAPQVEAAAAEIAPLAAEVGAHPGSLVSLALAIAARGTAGAAAIVDASAAALRGLDLGERARALAVGAEVALRTLPEEARRKLPLLGVFQGGGHLTAIAAVLELDVESDEEVLLAEALIAAGLAEMLPENYMRFHPALAAALAAELGDAERAAARASWAEATAQLVDFLCQKQIKNPQLAADLTLLDLRNLLALLEHCAATADAGDTLELAGDLESLIGPLGRPAALAHLEAIRDRVGSAFGEWSHEEYLIESAAVEALMDAGRPADTVAAAQKLLHRAETMGAESYDGAASDLATIHLTLGLAQLMAGEAELAMTSLEEARQRFHDLAAAGHGEAARMEAQAIARTGDALRAAAYPGTAAETYERAIVLAEKLGDRRQAAEVRTQLGALRLAQDRTLEALAAFADARDIFTQLDEPRTVAGIWHQIGAVHESAGNAAEAGEAHRHALDLELQLGDRAAAATTLGELGNLEAANGQLEVAVESFRHAAEIFAELDDLAREGIARSQMADKLMRLERYDEAREELLRTVECDAPFGHAVEPWRTFSMLSHLEEAAGHADAARAARQQATLAYLRYRRDGGAPLGGRGEIFAEVAQAMRDGSTDKVAAELDAIFRRRDLPPHLRALIPALKAILGGSRDKALAADPNLYYRDAAELLLQLESLEESSLSSEVVF